MKRVLRVAGTVLVLSCLLTLVETRSAEAQGAIIQNTVEKVESYRASSAATFITLTGYSPATAMCVRPGSSIHIPWVDATDAGFDIITRIAIAAQLAGREVRIEYDGTCRISRIQLL